MAKTLAHLNSTARVVKLPVLRHMRNVCSRHLSAGSGDPAQTSELMECRILMRKRTHNAMKGENSNEGRPVKDNQSSGGPLLDIRPRPSLRVFC